MGLQGSWDLSPLRWSLGGTRVCWECRLGRRGSWRSQQTKAMVQQGSQPGGFLRMAPWSSPSRCWRLSEVQAFGRSNFQKISSVTWCKLWWNIHKRVNPYSKVHWIAFNCGYWSLHLKSQAYIYQVLTIPVLTFQIRQSSSKMTVKSSLKDKLEDDELDLSMMQLSEVPVRVRHLWLKHLVHKIFLPC